MLASMLREFTTCSFSLAGCNTENGKAKKERDEVVFKVRGYSSVGLWPSANLEIPNTLILHGVCRLLEGWFYTQSSGSVPGYTQSELSVVNHVTWHKRCHIQSSCQHLTQKWLQALLIWDHKTLMYTFIDCICIYNEHLMFLFKASEHVF